ncbi:uncharacterized protein LOC118187748 [Stegodyphus dumicola]|uniref:uncharacterized protein LOC118187748 n=1 Tax=Stegodyphus dumicola TaxID=202533 RepID=UPI0015AA694F|nr:uncharacterized protein LOC118187748 [Stegodyphus dumicola]
MMNPLHKDMAGLFGKKSERATSLDLEEGGLNFPGRRLNENESVASSRPSTTMKSEALQGFNQGGARPKQKLQKKKKPRSKKGRDLDLNNPGLKSEMLIRSDKPTTEAASSGNEAMGTPKRGKNRHRRNLKTRENMNCVEEEVQNLQRLSLQDKEDEEGEASSFIKSDTEEKIHMPKIKINLKSKFFSATFPAMKWKKI